MRFTAWRRKAGAGISTSLPPVLRRGRAFIADILDRTFKEEL